MNNDGTLFLPPARIDYSLSPILKTSLLLPRTPDT